MSNEVMTRNSEWMNHIVNHLNRMVDNFERAVMNYRPMLGGERFMTDKELCARLQFVINFVSNLRRKVSSTQ